MYEYNRIKTSFPQAQSWPAYLRGRYNEELRGKRGGAADPSSAFHVISHLVLGQAAAPGRVGPEFLGLRGQPASTAAPRQEVS